MPSPATAAAGSISLAESHLAAMIADCAIFQTWTGSADATEADGHVYFHALPPPAGNATVHSQDELVALRPAALVYTDDAEGGFSRQRVAISDAYDFADRGRLIVEVFDNVEPSIANDPAELERRFLNHIGQLMDQLCERAGTAGFLAFDRITLRAGPYRTHEDAIAAQGDAIGATLLIEWSET